jgi:hypothetical protein
MTIVGLDLGDRFSSACTLDPESGEVRKEWRLPTTRQSLARYFAGKPRCASLSKWAPLTVIAELNDQLRRYDRQLEALGERHAETAALRQIAGIGPLTSLAYVLTLEDPARFRDSRRVGAYLGLTPGTRQSGDRDPQMHITKEGDPFLRQLLVQSAHYILEPFGPDCDLRRHGLALANRGGKAAKKRAAVAVACKLAVLMHRLWLTQQPYEPLRDDARAAARAGAESVVASESRTTCGRCGSPPPARPASTPPTGPAAAQARP